jgi:hypothetical protein
MTLNVPHRLNLRVTVNKKINEAHQLFVFNLIKEGILKFASSTLIFSFFMRVYQILPCLRFLIPKIINPCGKL